MPEVFRTRVSDHDKQNTRDEKNMISRLYYILQCFQGFNRKIC